MLQFLMIAALGYGGVIASLYFAQGWLIFPGSAFRNEGRGPVLAESLELQVEDGVSVHGHLFRSKGASDLVIGFGGNAQDANLLGQDLAARVLDAHVAVFHYRGYGPSGGQPSERALLEDAVAIHDHLVRRLKPKRVFAVGVSLGSAVATWLSSQRDLAGLVLITPFDSVAAIARETYPWLPVNWLLKHRFASVDFMKGNATPVAVISAGQDRTVRPERTQALVERLDNLVFHAVIEDATHNTILAESGYALAFRQAMDALARQDAPHRLPSTAD